MNSPHTPILQAENLWYSYDGQKFVLQGADFEARRGVLTMVLGRSGSGKTTLLKALAGLIQPQRGRLRRLKDQGPAVLGSARIAYIPQTLGLVRGRTALENTLTGTLASLGTFRSMVRWFPAGVVSEAKALLANLGLAGKWDQKVFNLSGGERQRVAVARALMQKPELVLADEYVSQLDPITADEILHLTRKLASQGIGFVITTHELDVVENYADEFKIVDSGKIAHAGTVEQFNSDEVRNILKGVSA